MFGGTANKAWWGSLGTLLTYILARFGLGDAPPIEDFLTALKEVAYAIVAYLLGWVGIWLSPKNKPATP